MTGGYKVYIWNNGIIFWWKKKYFKSVEEFLQTFNQNRFTSKSFYETTTFIISLKRESYKDEMVGIVKNGIFNKL